MACVYEVEPTGDPLGCIDQDEIPEGSDAITQWHH